MLSLAKYFETAPREFLAALHARHLERQGLYQTARLIEELRAWVLSPERVDHATATLPLSARELLEQIYLAGPRGLTVSEIEQWARKRCEDDLPLYLDLLQERFVVLCRRGAIESWHGFAELADLVLGRRLEHVRTAQSASEEEARAVAPPKARPASAAKTGREDRSGRRAAAEERDGSEEDAIVPPEPMLPPGGELAQAVAALLAQIRLGRLRTTRTGEIHRRDRADLLGRFSFAVLFGEEAQNDALDLALRFLWDTGWLLQTEGRILVEPAALAVLDAGLPEWIGRLRAWWRTSRLGGQGWIEECVVRWGREGLPAGEACEWFWAWDGRRRTEFSSARSVAWMHAPRLLREAWMLGHIAVQGDRGKLVHVWPSSVLAAPPERQTEMLSPDFQLILSPGVSLRSRYLAELLCQREGDDVISRYRLTRDSFLAGLGAGLGLEELDAWMQRLGVPPNVRFAIDQWREAQATCVFRELAVLQVLAPARQRELAALPQVRALIVEEIPGWGFVVEPEREEALREILRQLGFEPPPRQKAEPTRALDVLVPVAPWDLSIPAVGDPVHPRIDQMPGTRARFAENSKYGGPLKALPYGDLLHVLEFAILVESEIELLVQGFGNRRLRMRPRRLERRRDPAMLFGDVDGEATEIAVDRVRKIRVI